MSRRAEESILRAPSPGVSRWAGRGKRVVDVGGAALLVLLASPILVAAAALVKVSSRGPVLFVQERLGRRGKRFRLYKLRTMCADAEMVLHADAVL